MVKQLTGRRTAITPAAEAAQARHPSFAASLSRPRSRDRFRVLSRLMTRRVRTAAR